MTNSKWSGVVERLFFEPKPYQWVFIILLLPFSLVYGFLMWIRRLLSRREVFGVPIVSIGNLILGGSGKTPFVIALGSLYPNTAIISRGYGRLSKGLVEVSRNGKILASIRQSGDEAMLMALSLPKCSVFVSEDRKKAIRKAINRGAKQIILDDGFNRVDIEKFEILLEPSRINNPFPLPAGPFREPLFCRRYADMVLQEPRDFKREVTFSNLCERMVLVTAISQPQRLDAFLPRGVVGKLYFADHAYFDEAGLKALLEQYHADSLLVTQKDAVKMSGFKLPLSIIQLKLKIDQEYLDRIDLVFKGTGIEK